MNATSPQTAKGPSANKAWASALERSQQLAAPGAPCLAGVVEAAAAAVPERPALVSARETFTYGELAVRIGRYRRFARSAGFAEGGRIGLLMTSRPEFVAAWLGLTAAGARVALIGPELEAPGIAHAARAAGARSLLVEAALVEKAEAARNLVDLEIILLRERGLSAEAAHARPSAAQAASPLDLADEALQIFTSGTTGLPKAARISHRRILAWSGWFAGMMALAPDDRLYNPLPLHHSVGGVAALGAALSSGASVVVRERFSARAFWSEIADYECSVFQYIGELCRYLLNAPEDPAVGRHRLRLACGNGLAADVWTPFKTRFAIPQILEFYASTEGNFSLFNVEERVGAVGRIPPILAHRLPVALLRVDAETAEPVRGPDGFCLRCGVDEAGEAVAPIMEAGPGVFEGYADEDATQRKILRDVFKAGDAYYRSGDLMRRDAAGFYAFVDRLGDTFRWKGENVSTLQVRQALLTCPGVDDAVVYGVKVPGAEGRAGMAALVTAPSFDPAAVRAHLEPRLPSYARPLFLRLTPALKSTATFKPQKGVLASEGFDPQLVHDPLFLDDPRASGPQPLDLALFADIQAGRQRL